MTDPFLIIKKIIAELFRKKHYLAPSFIFSQRLINFLYTYFVIQILTQFEFANYSILVYVCSFTLQILKYGYDLRFQRLIFKLNRRKSYNKLKVIYSKYSTAVLALSSAATVISALLYAVFFENVKSLRLFDFVSIFMALFGLFGLSLITTVSYAISNFYIIAITLILQFVCYVAALVCLQYIGSQEAFFIYSLAASIPVFYILSRYYGLRVLGHELPKIFNIKQLKFRQQYIVYVNNTSINFFQIVLVSFVAHVSPLWISEYRVLQSLHTMISLLPIAFGGYLFNAHLPESRRSSSHSNFISVHFYLIICGFAILFHKSIVYFFPKYSLAIEQTIDLYLILNIVTVISNSFLFASFSKINIRAYIYLIAFFFPLVIIFLYYRSPQSLREFIYVDFSVQILFYICLLLSSSRSIINLTDVIHFSYFLILFVLVSSFSPGANTTGLILIIVSVFYLFLFHFNNSFRKR